MKKDHALLDWKPYFIPICLPGIIIHRANSMNFMTGSKSKLTLRSW